MTASDPSTGPTEAHATMLAAGYVRYGGEWVHPLLGCRLSSETVDGTALADLPATLETQRAILGASRPSARRPLQVSAAHWGVVVLCDDATIWVCERPAAASWSGAKKRKEAESFVWPRWKPLRGIPLLATK